MKLSPTAEEHQERGKALRDTFHDMPHGRDVLFGALLDAAAPDRENSQPAPIAEHDGRE